MMVLDQSYRAALSRQRRSALHRLPAPCRPKTWPCSASSA